MMGLIAGLAFGVVLSVLLEYRDTTLKTDSDVLAALSLPVLAVIPVMLTETDRRQLRRRRLWFAAAGVAVVILIAVAGAIWKPELLRSVVR
jgi:hypothetical protein